MFAQLLRDFGLIRMAEMAGEDMEEDPDKGVKEAFSEIRQVVTGQGDKEEGKEENDNDDDENCGFCIFMKAGGCKKEFTAWSKCVDTKRGDGHNFTEECRDPTINLQQCMEEHRDYYQDFMMDAASMEEESSDRSIQPASPDEQQSNKKDIQGNTEANKQVKVPEDHDSSSGTENPNKGKNDAKGVTDQVKEKRESSSEQQPEKEDKAGWKSSNAIGQVYAAGQKDDASKGSGEGSKGGDGDSKVEAPEGGKPDAPHAGQKQSDKHDIKGHTEANKQVKVAEDHDSSSGTKDNRTPEQKVLQASNEEEGHTGHVLDDGTETNRGAVVGASASAVDDVDEPLPPTENVLSGFEEKFEPGKDGNEGEEGEDGGDKEGGEEEEEAEEKPVIEVKTASYDHRFPATNQARHCYTRYNEYHRCIAQKGEGAEECRVFQRAYRSLCPGEWLERWNEQREEGTWPGRY